MNQQEKEFYKAFAKFAGMKLALFILIAWAARASRKAAGK